MKIIFKLKSNNKAVSEMLGWLLVFIIISTATVVILLNVMQPLSEKKTKSLTDVMAEAFEGVDSNIVESLSSTGVAKKQEISLPGGMLTIDPVGDRIAVWYTYNASYDFNVSNIDNIDFTGTPMQINDSINIDMSSGAENPSKRMIDKINSTENTSGVLIQLFSDDYPSPTDPAAGSVSFGAIWIFDLGRITYDSYNLQGDGLDPSSGSQSSKVIYENRGVIRDTLGNRYLQFSKNIDSKGDDIIHLNLELIKGNPVSASGGGVYQLDLEILNYYSRNTIEPIVHNLKMQISGEYMDEWYDYLTSPIRPYDVKRQSGFYEDTLLFNNGAATNLVFTTFVVNVRDVNVK